MQQWVNDPKNRPIVYGVAAVVMVGAIVFILFTVGIIGAPAPYVPPSVPVANSKTGPATPAGAPGAADAVHPASPASAPAPMSVAQRPGAPVGKPGLPAAKKPLSPVRQVAALPGAKPGPQVPGAPAPAAAAGRPGPAAPPVAPGAPAAVPTQVAGVPDPRPDPFAPYGVDLAAYIDRIKNASHPKARVDSYALPLIITNYAPATPTITAPVPGPSQFGGPGTGPVVASPVGAITLSGVMLGTGAYAIVNSGGQSQVLQPGDELPGGAGQLYSIQTDSITVKATDGSIVKIPITEGSAAGANPQNGPGNMPGNGNT